MTMPGGDFHTLILDNLTFEVDASIGGRVTAFRIDGKNLLSEAVADPDNFGSTFWTSPQTQWGWPPVVEIDGAPYEPRREGATIVMMGPVCSLLGVRIEKRFTALASRRAVEIEYRIHNAKEAAASVTIAPWEVTRLHPHGLTFFPTGEGLYPPSNLPVVDAGGLTWFAYDPRHIAGHPKLFADASDGWIAHVDQRTLFVKTFPPVPRARQAPGEAVVEIYAHPALTYMEIEQQGPLLEIPAGAASAWSVRWYLRRLPEAVEVAVGSPSLAAFVAAVIAGDA
ncbi:MAG TPA: DUF4380 domain-containing protein [Polyangia bacterium]|nr:DUF4380 domain-containing protein [Polyangia bacterium]